MSSELETLFTAREFLAVIECLRERAQTAREETLLGLSYLRTGQFMEAEFPLMRASLLGDPEGTVEYGNILRLLGRLDEAIPALASAWDTVQDMELRLRALRWWGVAEFESGATAEGIQRVQRAWHGYIAFGETELAGRVTQTLAQMHIVLGDTARARQLLTDAIAVLPARPNPVPRLDALRTLLGLQTTQGDIAAALHTLSQGQEILSLVLNISTLAHWLANEADLRRLQGDLGLYILRLNEVLQLAEQTGDRNLRLWGVTRLADQQSLLGQHGQAIQTLLSYGEPPDAWPPELLLTEGVLRRRRGDLRGAEDCLRRAQEQFEESGEYPNLIRALLHRSFCTFRQGQDELTVQLMQAALTHLMRLGQLHNYRMDLEELDELMRFAVMDPDLSPYVEPLLGDLAHLSGEVRLPEDDRLLLNIRTLGQNRVERDGEVVRLGMTGSVPLLTYLHLHPGRTRAEIQTELFPERDPQEGAAYIRQVVRELREVLGQGVVVVAGPGRAPTYRLGPQVQVELDLLTLEDAVSRSQVPRAVMLYRGEFLPGLDESDWLLTHRERALISVTLLLGAEMARQRELGDHRKVVLIANQLLRIDPGNVQVMEERLTAARLSSPLHEIAEYQAQLNRMLN